MLSNIVKRTFSLPGYAARLHVVGQRHVVAPHVELPFPQSQYATQHVSGVYADPHVHVEPCGFSDESLTIDGRALNKIISSESRKRKYELSHILIFF